MKKIFVVMSGLFLTGVIVMASCAQYTPSPSAVATLQFRQSPIAPVMAQLSPTVTPSATQDPEFVARATLLYLHATDTAVAGEKTEIAFVHFQETRNAETQVQSVIQTRDVQSTFDAGTAIATITQVEGTKQATQTQGVQTAIATMTHAALTAAARSTQIVQTQKLYASVAMIWLVFLVALTGSMLGLFWLYSVAHGKWLEQKARHIQDSKIEPDLNGRYPVIPASALPGKNNERMVDMNLAHRAVTDVSSDDLTAEQALANTQSLRHLEAVRSIAGNSVLARRMLGSTKAAEAGNDALPNAGVDVQKIQPPMLSTSMRDMPLPEWSRLNDWDGKLMTYGVGQNNQLLLADPKEEPHWMIVGRTRSYKSRGGLRTLSVSALTMGYQMLFIGKRVDFFPFEGHPNAKIVPVDLFNDPEAYLQTLRKVAILMKQRDDYLTERRMSIWQQTGRPQLYVVLDEFSAAVRQLNFVRSGAGNLVSSMATALVQEGAKYGISIIQVVQDATGKNVDISARRNMGKMVFRLSEQRASEVALGVSEPSAVGLPNRYFLSSIGEDANITLGVSFAPSDDEVQAFLGAHKVPALEPMDWIEGSVVTEKTEGERQNADQDIDAQIHQVLLRMKEQGKVSLSEAQREIYGPEDPRGGKHFQRIQAIWTQIQSATDTQNNAQSGTLPGIDTGSTAGITA